MARSPIAVFYTRGLNEPYTEGHIVVIRNLLTALHLAKVTTIVFNFRYGLTSTRDEIWENRSGLEQTIPLVRREQILHEKKPQFLTYSSVAEACGTLRFLAAETAMTHGQTGCVVNIVNCFRYPRVVLNRLLKRPLVLHIYMRGSIGGAITKLLEDRCDMIVASSRTVEDRIRNVHSVRGPPIQVIYPPIDTNVFSPTVKHEARAELGIPVAERIILCMGGLKHTRFPDSTVLQSIRHLIKLEPRTRLLIFAPRTRENAVRMTQIRLEAAHLGLNGRVDVRLANLSDRQKSLIYSASDILLFPSVDSNTAIEPPLTVLEALACALPVLAHDVCSANEVVLDGVNGCIMPFGSISADGIAEKAYEMLCDQKTIRRLSGNSRQIVVEKMSLAKSGERLARLYGDLATK